jgi:hypothetical protein
MVVPLILALSAVTFAWKAVGMQQTTADGTPVKYPIAQRSPAKD